MKYFKVFNTESEYHAYVQGDDFIAPNISTLYDCTKTWILEGREVIHVTGVTLNKSSISIAKDKTSNLEATVTPNDAADKSVTWSSSNENVATVDSNGVVSGVASGDATITVTTVDGGFTAQCSVSVSNHDYSEEYLSFTALEDATFKFTKATQYSIDGGDTWVALQSNTYTPTISAGDKIYWKASLSGNTSAGTFSSTGEYNACGNPMSLLYGDNFINQTAIGTNKFRHLFYNNEKLISISNLSLPATTLANSCYYGMFSACTNLMDTVAELPATTMASECYRGMFDSCSSLTTISFTLPAMTMADGCYRAMFSNCTNLTETIELPATTLANSCYYAMFSNCVALTDIPELPATTLAVSGYSLMFYECDGLVDLSSHTLSATTLAEHCYHSMFSKCSNLTAAPTLPTETLVNNCYFYMFGESSKLSYVKCLATDISATNSTYNWLMGAANTGTFVKAASMDLWKRNASGIPTNWTVEDYGDVSVTGVTLSPSSITINKDATHILTATVLPNNATDKSVTWASSDATIATVDSNGVVSGVASGDATITVTTVDGGFTAQCSVSVSEDAPHDYSLDYFTIESLTDNNTVKFIVGSGNSTPNNFAIDYSTDSGSTWNTIQSGQSRGSVVLIGTINSGDTMLLRSTANTWGVSYSAHSSVICSDNYIVYGNVMSLLFGENFPNQISLSSKGTFALTGLFWANQSKTGSETGYSTTNTTLISAENLVLPATTLKNECYNGMFRGCVNLKYSPKELPALTLETGVYSSMFDECHNLETTPDIMATGSTDSTSQQCRRMFRIQNTSVNPKLTTAPVLRVSYLRDQFYEEMFKGQKNLNYIKCLAKDFTTNKCLNNWVNGVASTGTFVKLSSANWGNCGSSKIPCNWTVESATE